MVLCLGARRSLTTFRRGENLQLGCPHTTTPPLCGAHVLKIKKFERHNCDLNYEHWELGWTDVKKRYCCDTVGRACDPYDCSEGLEQWP